MSMHKLDKYMKVNGVIMFGMEKGNTLLLIKRSVSKELGKMAYFMEKILKYFIKTVKDL